MSTYPKAYLQYLVYFHMDRDYFECHEVLEAFWKQNPNHPFRNTWVGFIQIAVGLYHQRRDNLAGARKMLANALKNLKSSHVKNLGIDSQQLGKLIQDRLVQLESAPNVPYVDLNLPIVDEALLELCYRECFEQGGIWGQMSDIRNTQLIHKHTLRDRTEVIKERRKQQAEKMRQRGEME